MTDFAAVDTGDERALVAMMDATDAWSAVQAARAWVLAQVELGDGAIVVDAGCGPGSFGASVRGGAVDLDASTVMVRETRRRRPDARVVCGDVTHLPLRDESADLVHIERVLQWIADPAAALAELLRVVARGRWLAVTDTDWGTLHIDHLDLDAADRITQAALGWVPHARLARDLPSTIAALGVDSVSVRHDTMTISAWDPDDPAQHDGPPGLPLHSIAPHEHDAITTLAARARAGRFAASLTLVTCIATT